MNPYIRIHRRVERWVRSERLCYDFEWIGDPHGTIFLDIDYYPHRECGVRREGDSILGLPWPLLVIDEDWCLGSLVCVRTDRNPVALWIWLARYHAQRRYGLFTARLLWTAHIWGLGRIPECEVPSWDHLNIVRYTRRIIQRLGN